jgi:acyl carrier protein
MNAGGTSVTLSELKKKIGQILEVDPALLTDETGPESLESWDSMGHLKIISLLDDYVDDPIEAEEAEKLISFGEIVAFTRNRGILTD